MIDLIKEYGGADLLDLDAVKSFAEFCYSKGRADCLREAHNFVDQESYKEGYKRGLEQGRADKYKEIISEYMLLTEKQVDEIRADAIGFIVDLIIYPLLDEYGRGLWEHISYIPLAEKWIEALDNNQYPEVENYEENRREHLKIWILEMLKEQK